MTTVESNKGLSLCINQMKDIIDQLDICHEALSLLMTEKSGSVLLSEFLSKAQEELVLRGQWLKAGYRGGCNYFEEVTLPAATPMQRQKKAFEMLVDYSGSSSK